MPRFLFLFVLYAFFVSSAPVRAQNATAACPNGGNASDIYVSSFGAKPDGATDSTEAINRALACAVTSTAGPVTVHLGSGTYLAKCSTQSNTSCFSLVGNEQRYANGINIAGQGSGQTNILIANPNSGGFHIKNAASINISGLTIDYVTPPFVQGKIVSVNSDSFDFTVLPGGMQEIPDYLCRAYGTGNDNVDASPMKTLGIAPGPSFGLLMDSSNGKSVKHNALPGTDIFPTSCANIGPGAWRIGIKHNILPYVSSGDNYVQLIGRSFKKSGIWFDSSKNLSVTDVVIRSGGGLATLFTGNEGTIHLNKVQVRFAPNSKRFSTTDADAVHMQHNWATALIENSYFEGMADDAINVYSVALFASGTSSDGKSLEVRAVRPVHVGDTIEVLSARSGALRGTATVMSVAPGRGSGRLTLATNSPIPSVASGTAGEGGDIVFDVSAAGPNSIIRNNTFGRHRGRDIVDRSPNSLIANNKFLDVNWNAVNLTVTVGAFKEGPTARGVTISGNQIYGGDLPWDALIVGAAVAPHGVAAYGPTQISIVNNTLSSAVEKYIAFKGSAQVSIQNNKLFSLSCDSPSRIGIENSSAITLAGNSCSVGLRRPPSSPF